MGSFSGLISGFILIGLAHRLGISGKLRTAMIKNVIFDYMLGLIPILGNGMDFVYRSNERNVRLLEEHWIEGKHMESGLNLIIKFIILILIILLINLGLFFWVVYEGIKFLS